MMVTLFKFYMMMLRTISTQLAGVRTRMKPHQVMMIPPVNMTSFWASYTVCNRIKHSMLLNHSHTCWNWHCHDQTKCDEVFIGDWNTEVRKKVCHWIQKKNSNQSGSRQPNIKLAIVWLNHKAVTRADWIFQRFLELTRIYPNQVLYKMLLTCPREVE